MRTHEAGAVPHCAPLSTSRQYREALSRIRVLEDARANSPEGRERCALELAVSRNLSAGEGAKH